MQSMLRLTALVGGAALGAAGLAADGQAADAKTLPEIKVYGSTLDPAITAVERDELIFPAADGGDLLRSVPGVSVSRMGGHGLEPYIRGQKQGQLNLIDDGAFVHGGCPNRMDPPASFLQVDAIDELIVEKGYASVQNGAGGSGGTLRTVRKSPVFTDGKWWELSLSGGYDSSSNTRDAAAKGAMGTDTAWIRGNTEIKDAGNYEDGTGKDVRSSYMQKGARVDVGYAPKPGDELKLGFQFDRTDDALFAGAGMDSPLTENSLIRASFKHGIDIGGFKSVEASAFASYVRHTMDNYTLRTATGMGMLVDSDSDTFGVNLNTKGERWGTALTFGMDAKWNLQDATRYMGAQSQVQNVRNEQAFMWPDALIQQVGLFGEGVRKLSEESRLKAGLRYDNVYVTARRADRVAARTSQSANQLYNTYYGVVADDVVEHNVGGLVRLEYDLNPAHTLFAGVSRSVRTADVTERLMAGSHATASSRWVGRPDIDPEKHYQIDAGVAGKTGFGTWTGTVFYDKVQDYILRDKARAQDGVLLADDAAIYRNVGATLAGVELGGDFTFDRNWKVGARLAYTYGENDEDNRPLAQIPPLQLTTSVEYGTGEWLVGTRLRVAAKQDRADVEANNNSGLDAQKTSGYAVFNLYGRVFALAPFDVAFGVTNLFDKGYAEHLNRATGFNADAVQVNESGRSFFLRVNAEF